MADTTKKAADTVSKELPSPVAVRRGGPVQFFEEVRRETSKVTWPTWKETYLTTIVVFAMVGLTMTFFFLVDLLLSLGEKWVIGAMG